VEPDIYVLGKALGGGIVPLSAVVGPADVLGVLTPGSHGSTFGGNPLACAVGRAVLELLRTGEPQARAAELGRRLHARLAQFPGDRVTTARGRGLWAGVDLAPGMPPAHEVSEMLLAYRLLVKDSHGITLRLAPPLVIEPDELDWALDQLLAGLEAALR
jgi:ornithine--oxo-acid transaminase